MIARFLSYAGDTIGLILVRPDLTEEPQVPLEFPTDVGRHPISNVDSPRTFARSARYGLQYKATLRSVADCTEFNLFLNGLKDQIVAIPFWQDCCRLTAARNVGATSLPINTHPVRSGAEWIIISDDNAVYEIVTATAVTSSTLTIASPGLTLNWSQGATAYPLAFGYLPPADRPKVGAITPSRNTFTLKFKENSPYARRLNQFSVGTAVVGSTVPNLSALPLWDIMPAYEPRPLQSSEIEAIYELIGFGRVDGKTVYNQYPARGLEMKFVCRDRAAIAKIEKFFADRKGTTSLFAIPTFRNDLSLAQDLPIGGSPNLIRIQSNYYSDGTRPLHPSDAYLALWDRGSDAWSTTVTIDTQKVLSTSGTDLTTVVAIAGIHLRANTIISALLAVRLVESKLTWSYTTEGRATCTLKFLERPNEYTTLSPVLPEPAFICMITEQTPYPQTQRVTNYEDEIVLDGSHGDWAGTYTPINASFRNVRRSLDLSVMKMRLKFGGDFTANPLKRFFPFRLEGKLKARLGEVDMRDLSLPVKPRFSGELTDPTPSLTEADAVPFGQMWKQLLPRFVLSKVDNWSLFFAELGLEEEDWRFPAQLVSVVGEVLVCERTSGDPPDPTNTDPLENYFAGGFMNIGTGADYNGRSIQTSVSVGEGKQLTIVLDHPLSVEFEPGTLLNLWPGYDGTIDQLETRFGARENHGGHAYVPDTPPNIRAVKPVEPSGGKKG